MKAWITKYALSKGLLVVDAEEMRNATGMICVQAPNCHPTYFHEEGRDWCRSEQAAIVRAQEMRRKKLAALHKQIAKLEKMTFEVTH